MTRKTAHAPAGMDADLLEGHATRPFTKRHIYHEIVAIIEFAWLSGLLTWTPEKYARAMLTLFPAEYGADDVIERSKYAFKMNERSNLIMQSGGKVGTPGAKKVKRRTG